MSTIMIRCLRFSNYSHRISAIWIAWRRERFRNNLEDGFDVEKGAFVQVLQVEQVPQAFFAAIVAQDFRIQVILGDFGIREGRRIPAESLRVRLHQARCRRIG